MTGEHRPEDLELTERLRPQLRDGFDAAEVATVLAIARGQGRRQGYAQGAFDARARFATHLRAAVSAYMERHQR